MNFSRFGCPHKKHVSLLCYVLFSLWQLSALFFSSLVVRIDRPIIRDRKSPPQTGAFVESTVSILRFLSYQAHPKKKPFQRAMTPKKQLATGKGTTSKGKSIVTAMVQSRGLDHRLEGHCDGSVVASRISLGRYTQSTT